MIGIWRAERGYKTAPRARYAEQPCQACAGRVGPLGYTHACSAAEDPAPAGESIEGGEPGSEHHRTSAQ